MVVAPFGIVIASVIDLSSAKSGADVVLQGVLIATCVTSAVTLFACILPDQSDKLLSLAGAGGIGLAISVALICALNFEISIWAWLAAIFFCFCFVYDMARSQEFSRTVKHAVDCSVDIFLDVALFVILVPIILLGAYISSF